MKSAVAAFYPGSKMSLICKVCRGNSFVTLEKNRCPICKQNLQDYKARGLMVEVIEWEALHKKWEEVRARELPTTGYKKLDACLEVLFGKPHSNNWRNYAQFPAKYTDPHIVLRTVVLPRRAIPQEQEPAFGSWESYYQPSKQMETSNG